MMKHLPFLLLFSCSQLIEVNSIEVEPTIVVNSIILPDSTIQVYVSESVPYQKYDGSNWVIENTKVSLYKNSLLEEVLTPVDSFYESNTRGEIGALYTLKIEHPENTTQIISSSTIIPRPVPIDTGFMIIGADFATYDIKFQDDGSAENYYEILVYRDFTKYKADFPSSPITSYRISPTWSTNEILIRNGLDQSRPYHTQLFSDEGYNGKWIQLTLFTEDSELFTVAEVFVVLYTIPKDYYKYKLSLIDQLWSRISQEEYSSGDIINPKIFKAIHPIIGNIDGGQGVVAGISFTKKQCSVIW